MNEPKVYVQGKKDHPFPLCPRCKKRRLAIIARWGEDGSYWCDICQKEITEKELEEWKDE